MRLIYDSVKPRRAELVIQQGDEFEVSERIGDQLKTVSGFKTFESPDELAAKEAAAAAAVKADADQAAKKAAAAQKAASKAANAAKARAKRATAAKKKA